MDKYQVKNIASEKDWEVFVLAHNPRSFLQSWNWGETNRLIGKKIFRLGFYTGSKLKGVCLVIVENAKRGRHFLIPGGPILNWSDKSLVKVFIKSIKDLAQKEDAWFVRVRPEIVDSFENQKLFISLGFVGAPMHLHAENTWILDISKNEDELLSGMRKTTRYLVKKSLSDNFSVDISCDPGKTVALETLQKETVARHEFVGFSKHLFKAQLATFGKNGQGVLITCKKGNVELVSAIIIFYGGCAYYHHSASSEESRKTNASYYLQWQVINEAKKRGCKIYNFWGVAPNDDPNHRFSGVTIFKKGFGGEQINWLHARDLPISPFYWFTFLFESVRKITRRL